MSAATYAWSALGVALVVGTFGPFFIIYLLVCVLAFLSGGVAVVFYIGTKKSTAMQNTRKGYGCGAQNPGIKQIVAEVEKELNKSVPKVDKRLTGSTIIDEQLQEVLEYTYRDYIQVWYQRLSEHDGFKQDIQQTIQKIVIAFSQRSKDVDLVPYFTTRLTNDFVSHLTLFRKAQEKVHKLKKQGYAGDVPSLERACFEVEAAEKSADKTKLLREKVCTDSKSERQYLQDLSDVLLYLVLPAEDFHNKPFRYLCREVCVNGILQPLIDLLTDPDYINQYIAWMCKEGTFNPDSFLTTLKITDNIDELDSVIDMVEADIARQRSKDTGGEKDTEIKQQLKSLLYVEKICRSKKRRLQREIDTVDGLEDEDFVDNIYKTRQNLPKLSLKFILQDNLGISYFLEYLTVIGAQNYMFFYLNIEGFRASAEQCLSAALLHRNQPGDNQPDLESVREASLSLFDQYLSVRATSKVVIADEAFLNKLSHEIRTKAPSDRLFDEVQKKIFDKLLNDASLYRGFKQSHSYVRLLSELDMLKDSDDADSLSGDSLSLMQMEEDTSLSEDTESSQAVQNFSIMAYIEDTAIANEDGKSYAVFLIRVTKTPDGEASDSAGEVWDTYRRYSDFHDLHMTIKDKFDSLAGLVLPGKTIFNHTDRNFLVKRQKELDVYLQAFLKPQVLKNHPGLREIVGLFLDPVAWEKGKSQLARKMDTFVNPLKSVGRNLGNVMRAAPDNVWDGVIKVTGGIKVVLSDVFKTGQSTDGKDVTDGSRMGTDDNMALRIMLQLMDEAFDLRKKNQWLRKRIVMILQQIIRATFGDKINRKIVEHVESLTSAEQIASYIKQFKDSFWPDGVLAQPRPNRDRKTKMRTRVACKAKMLGSISDVEMRHLIGSDTTRRGVIRVFEMFQHRALNKRLLYVTIEGLLETMFPDNKFPEIFQKLHSNSEDAASEQNESELHVTGIRNRKGSIKV